VGVQLGDLDAIKEEIAAQLGSLSFLCEDEAEPVSVWAVLACCRPWERTQVENADEVCAAALLTMMSLVLAEVKLTSICLPMLHPCCWWQGGHH